MTTGSICWRDFQNPKTQTPNHETRTLKPKTLKPKSPTLGWTSKAWTSPKAGTTCGGLQGEEVRPEGLKSWLGTWASKKIADKKKTISADGWGPWQEEGRRVAPADVFFGVSVSSFCQFFLVRLFFFFQERFVKFWKFFWRDLGLFKCF